MSEGMHVWEEALGKEDGDEAPLLWITLGLKLSAQNYFRRTNYMKRLAATLALGLLVSLLVGTGVASAAGTAGQDSATGHVPDATGVTQIPQDPPPCPTPPFCPPPPPPIQSNVSADVDFSAKSSFNNTDPSGSAKFTFRNEDPDQVFTGKVTCLIVQGGFANLSGPITESKGGSTLTAGGQVFQPRSFLITANDSGKFSTQPDVLGFIISPQPATDVTCNSQFGPSDVVREGEVVVKDSLG
jgi:hypothetical protein